MDSSITSSADDEFSPEPRGRCYTWPMQQFLYEPPPDVLPSQQPPSMVPMRDSTVAKLLAATSSPSSTSAMGSHLMPLGMMITSTAGHLPGPPKKKRCRKKPADQLAQKKPNPWGEESYSDIIAKALETAPDGRLKLNEIYQWFSDNIPYFRERSSQEEAAGWKNSIRHNLSLHSRFMRIQNEGAGKSSWWVINPDAKPGRNPRRTRACTLDSTSKAVLEKKRRGARKKAMDSRAGGTGMGSTMSSLAGSQASIMSPLNMYADEEGLHGSFDPSMFRARAASNLSVPGSSSRVSPTEQFEDFEFPSWVEVEARPPIPSDILDRTDQMRIDACRGGSMSNGVVKQEPGTKIIKSEAGAPPPPSYQELNSVRGPSQLQNPLLRNHQITSKYDSGVIPSYPIYNWASPMHLSQQGSCAAAQGAAVGSLPIDLENLTLPDQPLMEMDVESLLRHELSQTRDHRINFEGI